MRNADRDDSRNELGEERSRHRGPAVPARLDLLGLKDESLDAAGAAFVSHCVRPRTCSSRCGRGTSGVGDFVSVFASGGLVGDEVLYHLGSAPMPERPAHDKNVYIIGAGFSAGAGVPVVA